MKIKLVVSSFSYFGVGFEYLNNWFPSRDGKRSSSASRESSWPPARVPLLLVDSFSRKRFNLPQERFLTCRSRDWFLYFMV
jgi:hypothetical protein